MKKNVLLLLVVSIFISCGQQSNEKEQAEEAVVQSSKCREQNSKSKEQSSKLKIAWVQLDSVQNNYEYYKEIQKELESKQAKAESTMEQKGKTFAAQYQALQKRAQSGELTQEEYEKEGLRLQQAQANLESLEAKLSMQLQKDAIERQKALVDTVRAQVKAYAKEKGYDFVLCQSNDINNILYAGEAYDVTDEIIALLNKHYKKQKQ